MTASNLGPLDYDRALAAAGLHEVTAFHRQTTGSTNDDARSLVAAGWFAPEAKPAIVVAETQTRGRGRGSNVWLSPEGAIALTITTSDVLASQLGTLPLGVGTAVVWALRQLGVPAAVKWPNDVLIEGRKVCGILCESSLLEGVARVFIGIGINVDTAPPSTPEIHGSATALADHGLTVDRPALVAGLTARVLALIRERRESNLVVEAWKAVSVPWWGEEVSFVEGAIERRVTLLDVNPDGRLVVRDAGGVIRSLVSGEVRQMRRLPA